MTEQSEFSASMPNKTVDSKNILMMILGEKDECVVCGKYVDITSAVSKDDHVEFWYNCPRCGHKQGMIYNSKLFADRFREVFGDEGYRQEEKVS